MNKTLSHQPHGPTAPSCDHANQFYDHSDQFCVVAVGASAGGLHALSVILAALPPSFPAPILVAQHLSPDFPSQLAHILSRHTDLNVKQAEEGDRLRAGWVYVAPPDRHLLARADGTLALTLTHRVHHCRPSADVLFTSVSAAYGARAVGVVLTGGDGDGAAGVQAIKASGGVTMAQDQSSSQQPSMPRSAAATGALDFVLALPDIAAALVALTSPEKSSAPDRRSGLTSGNGSRVGPFDHDAITEAKGFEAKGFEAKGSGQGRAGREGVVELLTRRKAAAKAAPTAPEVLATPDALAKAAADLAACTEALAACTEALGVAEEALRVQSDVITSYRLSLGAEALGPPTR